MITSPSPSSIAKRISENIPQLLVLHFDVNETLLVADAAGGDTHEDSLNKIIAKSAFCKIPPEQIDLSLKDVQPEYWMDGSVIALDEKEKDRAQSINCWDNIYTEWDWPDGCCPYYKTSYKKYAKKFTEHPHGQKFKPIKDEIRSSLRLDSEHLATQSMSDVDKRISHDNVHHYILPAFFECLYQLLSLSECSDQIRIVIRTFGSDLSEVTEAINAFAEGKHPFYPDFHCPKLKLSDEFLFRGRWKKLGNSSDIIYQLNTWTEKDTDYDTRVEDFVGEVTAIGDEKVLNLIEGRTKSSITETEESLSIACGIQDDYNFWSSNNYAPYAGKPVWIRSSNVHHIFFDDNIHNDPVDSIVSVRSELEQSIGTFRSLNGKEIIEMHGKHIVKVPTIEPCLNRSWFLTQIHQCLSNIKQ